MLQVAIQQHEKTLWFCGHSLGAAIATICAFRCQQTLALPNPQELHTFGSPRVGCKRYVKHADVKHFRWVHNNDIVTRVPPPWMGYRHGGEEVYLDRHGRIRRLRGIFRSRDRWRGLLTGLLRGSLIFLAIIASTNMRRTSPGRSRKSITPVQKDLARRARRVLLGNQRFPSPPQNCRADVLSRADVLGSVQMDQALRLAEKRLFLEGPV